MSAELEYKRILLKISGEALAGENKSGIDSNTLGKICDQIKILTEMGVEVLVVVGGGNFWRGRNSNEIERTTSDYMGMLATSINALALESALKARGAEARVQTAIEMREIAEAYTKQGAMHHLKKGRIVIFACGTGNPFFSTDTTAALRAAEMEADVILFAKTTDGVYSADPKIDANAQKYDHISYLQIINHNLKVLDSTATTLCMDNKIPFIIFGIDKPENIVKIAKGDKSIGTIVK